MRSLFSARLLVTKMGRNGGVLTVNAPPFRPIFVTERRAEKSDRTQNGKIHVPISHGLWTATSKSNFWVSGRAFGVWA